MPKGKKKYRRKNYTQTPEKSGYFADRPKREKTPEETREYVKLFLFMITWIIFLLGVYMVCNELEFGLIFPIYAGLGLVLFIVWVIYNGGFKKIEVDNLEKPEETSYEDFCAFIEKLKARKRKAKYFLILFMPFILILLVHGAILNWSEMLSR